MDLTQNEKDFLAAAREMMRSEGRNEFCWVDLSCYGYARPYATRHATLGSLVKKGVVTEPYDGWASIVGAS